MTAADLKRSPLDTVHRGLGAKMGAFAGWDMPIEYQGTLAEHRAVREAVGVFDLSHLGKVEVAGDGARGALQHALSNDLERLTEPGAAQYTLCLTDEGTIVDDLIVYREPDGYLLVPNAANWPNVAEAVRASAGDDPATSASGWLRRRTPGWRRGSVRECDRLRLSPPRRRC